jgi:hypothetical protein
MSGIIPDSILSVDIDGVDENGSGDYYCLVSFPQKVIVTGVKFTVNGEMRGEGPDATDWDRIWELGAMKGRKSVGVDDPAYYEDIVPFFGDNEKPTVNCGQGDWTSNVSVPVEEASWWSTTDYVGNVAQMDPDEYLMLYVSSDGGDFETYDLTAAKVTIAISYTGSSPNV